MSIVSGRAKEQINAAESQREEMKETKKTLKENEHVKWHESENSFDDRAAQTKCLRWTDRNEKK